jgi:phosphoglycolate phosphatase-like HAD superfamily hydrolase
MKRNNAQAKDCIFIGDTIFDAQCAKAAGITFALIEWRKPADPALNQEAKDLADFIVHNTDDILSII